MANAPQPPSQRLGLPGLAAIIVGFLLFGAATLWLRHQPAARTDLETDRARERSERLAKLHEGDATALSEYTWVDRDAGVVGLPLDRAIELALPQLKNKPVRQGPPIPPPADTNAPPADATSAPPAAPVPATSPPSNLKPQTPP